MNDVKGRERVQRTKHMEEEPRNKARVCMKVTVKTSPHKLGIADRHCV